MNQSEKVINALKKIDETIEITSMYWQHAHSQKDVDDAREIITELRIIRKKITQLIYT